MVIPWLKSANMNYPDFGSGNLNHLIPRIKMAVATQLNIRDMENIDIVLATSHFHDVVISKEGQTEGVDPLININYKGQQVKINMKKVWSDCAIAMPNDAQRNMMNASSDFEIIKKIILSLKNKETYIIHSPGADGNIGGYPVFINGQNATAEIYEKYFSAKDMKNCNLASIYLDGIEKVEAGNLYYSDELIEKVEKYFKVKIPKIVKLSEADSVAEFIVENIIEREIKK